MIMYYVHEMDDTRAVGGETEIRHLSKVMRKKVGDLVFITHGDGKLWQAEILSLGRSSVVFKPLKLIKQTRPYPKIALAVAPTKKPARMEDLVEKCVQLGLTDLHFVHTERTLRKELKLARTEQLALSAMKQCLRLTKLHIHPIVSYAGFLKDVKGQYSANYIGKVEEQSNYLINTPLDESTLILIGPEGDFTESEYAAAEHHGFQPVKLGEQRFRTEMAGIVAVSTVMNKRQLHHGK